MTSHLSFAHCPALTVDNRWYTKPKAGADFIDQLHSTFAEAVEAYEKDHAVELFSWDDISPGVSAEVVFLTEEADIPTVTVQFYRPKGAVDQAMLNKMVAHRQDLGINVHDQAPV